MKKLMLTACSILALGLATGAMAATESDQVMTQNGHEYVCTGVGLHARNDPRWGSFPLKLVFANPKGEYLSNISVSLSNAGGATVLDTHCDGPWFLAKLDAGRYKARVTSSAGREKTLEIEVPGAGQKQVVVTFNQE